MVAKHSQHLSQIQRNVGGHAQARVNGVSQQDLAANDAQTIWIKRDKMGMILQVHALYAVDFLHFTNNTVLYQEFQKQFRKSFYVKKWI